MTSEKLAICIVEDSETHLKSCIKNLTALASNRYSIIGFSDYNAALSYLSINRVDMLITDMGFPSAPAGSFVAGNMMMTCQRKNPDIKIIAVTGGPPRETVQQHFSGFADSLRKGNYLDENPGDDADSPLMRERAANRRHADKFKLNNSAVAITIKKPFAINDLLTHIDGLFDNSPKKPTTPPTR